jgi:hypothetical protein
MAIASPTGGAQIFWCRHATVFFHDDVINFVWEESHTSWKQALLAALSNPLYHEPTEFRQNGGHAH